MADEVMNWKDLGPQTLLEACLHIIQSSKTVSPADNINMPTLLQHNIVTGKSIQ